MVTKGLKEIRYRKLESFPILKCYVLFCSGAYNEGCRDILNVMCSLLQRAYMLLLSEYRIHSSLTLEKKPIIYRQVLPTKKLTEKNYLAQQKIKASCILSVFYNVTSNLCNIL